MRDQDIPLFAGDSPGEGGDSTETVNPYLRRDEFLKGWLFMRSGEPAVKSLESTEDDEESDEKDRKSSKKRFRGLFRKLFSNLVEDAPVSSGEKETEKKELARSNEPREVNLDQAEAFLGEPGVIYARADDKEREPTQKSEKSEKGTTEGVPELDNKREARGVNETDSHAMQRASQESESEMPSPEDKADIEDMPTTEERQRELQQRSHIATASQEKTESATEQSIPQAITSSRHEAQKPSRVITSFGFLDRSRDNLKKQVSSIKKQVRELRVKYRKDKFKPFDTYPYPPSEAYIRRAVEGSSIERLRQVDIEPKPADTRPVPYQELKQERVLKKKETAPPKREAVREQEQLQVQEPRKEAAANKDPKQEELSQTPEVVFERRHEVLDQPYIQDSNDRRVKELIRQTVSSSAVSVADVLAGRSPERGQKTDRSKVKNISQMSETYAKSLQTGFFAGIILIIIGLIAYISR